MQTCVEINVTNRFLDMFPRLQELNPALDLKASEHTITISEKDFLFSELGVFRIELPFVLGEEELEILEKEHDSVKLEWDEEGIIINMSTLGFIGIFTAAILITLGIWNRKQKMGKIVESSTGHDLEVDGKKIHRVPDIALHLEEKFTSALQQKMVRLGAPFFCIEVVSHKNSLSHDLQKMEKDWIGAGTHIGLVVCPYREEYYLFEKGKSGYTNYSFSRIFTHSFLPELELDFGAILQESVG